MTKEEAIEMYVGGLVVDPNTQAPIVVLKDESGEICLPIWIGVAEATSIASAVKQVDMARPLTHDLMMGVFQELGVRVQRVVITELKDSTYYSELVLSVGSKAMIVDSRPSDAIAIAVRASAPIYVTQSVLNQAKIKLEGETLPPPEGATEGEVSAAEEAADELENQRRDFRSIDKDKWQELLTDLDPDDFKYKM